MYIYHSFARYARDLGGGPQKVGQKGQKGHIVVFIDFSISAQAL